MADDVNKTSEQFRGLDMEALISAPLRAAYEARMMLAESSKEFIERRELEESDKEDK